MAMISFSAVHRWNAWLCPPLGILFNLGLLWLILNRTPKEMRVHSRILLQTCLLDFLLLAIQCFAQMVFTFDRRAVFVFFFEGYFVRMFNPSPSALWFLACFWTGVHNLSIFGIAVQFIYRYLVLNRDVNVNLGRYMVLLLGPALCILAMMTLLYGAAIGSLNEQPVDRQRFAGFVDFDQQQKPLYITTEVKEGNVPFLLGAALRVLLDALAYQIIFACGWKMVRFVREHTTLNSRLKDLNKQLTRSLLILASFPLGIGSLSLLFILDLALNRGVDGFDWTLEWKAYLMLACHWLPVLNPLTAIIINRPYRDALVGRLFANRNANAVTAVTQTI